MLILSIWFKNRFLIKDLISVKLIIEIYRLVTKMGVEISIRFIE